MPLNFRFFNSFKFKGLLVFLLLLITHLVFSQRVLNMSYAIGTTGITNSKTVSFSTPYYLSGQNCIVVSNGITVFQKGKDSIFNSVCFVNLLRPIVTDSAKPFEYNIKVYPNPVIQNTTVLYQSNTTTKQVFRLLLFNLQGQLLQDKNVTEDQLKQGYLLAMGSLTSGVYFIDLFSDNVKDHFKIIKL